MPELKFDSAPPVAVKRVPLPLAARLGWYRKAVYPAPYGTVWVRYSETENKEFLEIIALSGKLLQRVTLDPSPGTSPRAGYARYLEPARARGPLLYLKLGDWHHFYVFPDGFAGFLSQSSAPGDDSLRWETDKRGICVLNVKGKRRTWSGVDFSEASGPDISESASPRTFPFPLAKGETRFAGTVFDRLYFLRWVTAGSKAVLEIWEKNGRRIAAHPLRDGFGAEAGWTFLSAMWLDEKKKRGPVVVVRDSDSVRVHVFTDGMRRLIVAQDFNDGSSSLAATTVSFDRDKNGLLTVTESYSERSFDDGTGGASSESTYHWTGKSFS